MLAVTSEGQVESVMWELVIWKVMGGRLMGDLKGGGSGQERGSRLGGDCTQLSADLDSRFIHCVTTPWQSLRLPVMVETMTKLVIHNDNSELSSMWDDFEAGQLLWNREILAGFTIWTRKILPRVDLSPLNSSLEFGVHTWIDATLVKFMPLASSVAWRPDLGLPNPNITCNRND